MSVSVKTCFWERFRAAARPRPGPQARYIVRFSAAWYKDTLNSAISEARSPHPSRPCKKSAAHRRSPAFSCPLFAVCCSPPTLRPPPQSVARCLLFAACCPWFVACCLCLLFALRCLLLSAHPLLTSACHSLLSARRLPPATAARHHSSPPANSRCAGRFLSGKPAFVRICAESAAYVCQKEINVILFGFRRCRNGIFVYICTNKQR